MGNQVVNRVGAASVPALSGQYASQTGPARIGPNAVLQLLDVLAQDGDDALAGRLLAAAGLVAPPSSHGMMPEAPAAAFHQALRRQAPERAARLAARAGRGTADYILMHRIPLAAQRVLRLLPGVLAAPILVRAISRNAWTFAGSGEFRVVSTSPVVFQIADNPIVRGERADEPLCVWHAAVFTRLFAELVDPRAVAIETACCATGAHACRFEVHRTGLHDGLAPATRH